MDEARVGSEHAPGIGAVLRGARADEEHDIGGTDALGEQVARRPQAERVAADAERQRVAFVDRAFAHHGRGDGDLCGFLERSKFLRRA